MNAVEKAKILKANGYAHIFDTTGYSSVKLHAWAIGNFIVSENKNIALATHAAYAHYEAQQEITAQDANDAAGEAAYNEVVAEYNEAVAAVHELQTENNKLEKDARDFAQFYNQERAKRVTVESENATPRQQLNTVIDTATNRHIADGNKIIELRQQLADAQAENARLKAGLKLLVQTMDEKLRKTCNWHDYERARNQANDILVVVEHARTLKPAPAPVADVPQPLAEVTLTEDEIDWLAENLDGFGRTTEKTPEWSKSALLHDRLYSFTYDLTDKTYKFVLTAEYDTPANRAAIEARRKALGL